MGEPHVVTLRATRDGDLDALFRFRQDPHAGHMAAFTHEDPADRAAFDSRWSALMADPEVDLRTIRADGVVVGDLVRWSEDGVDFVGYWVEREHWGRGIVTRALQLFLDVSRTRPVHAHVAADNTRSIAVLEKLGFTRIGSERSFAKARGAEIEEHLYRLD
jgi:RimJ/RimL family protein N-acetyltransferase